MNSLLLDVRYALRTLARNPGFALVVILVLAVGIGANSAMFSLVNALLFQPLAVEQPEALVRVYSRHDRPDGAYRSFSYPNYADLRDRNTAFTDLAAFTVNMVGVQEGDTTRRAFAGVVSANFLRTFGVRPALGRDLLPEEEQPGSGVAVALVSHAYWEKHGADPGMVGSVVQINSRPFQVIGVTPRHFTGTTVLFSPDFWLPLGVYEQVVNDFTGARGRTLTERSHHALMLLGRLKPGLRPADAETQLDGLGRQMAEAYPDLNKDQRLSVAPPHRVSLNTNPQDHSQLKGLAALLLPMSGLVLVIACLNLANMMMARASARRREMAIRAALGGTPGRIIRQLLTEGFLLSLAGGSAGLLLAHWITTVLSSSLGAKLPFITVVMRNSIDGRVLGTTFGLCLLATLVFGLVPALRLARADVIPDLKDAGAQPQGGRRGFGLFAPRQLLVLGQLALSLMLLTIAGLFYRGAVKAAAADPGFRLDRGLLVEVDASLAGIDDTQGRALYRTVLERIRALPGVEAASFASMVPFGLFADGRDVLPAGVRAAREDAPQDSGARKPIYAAYAIIAEDYFKTVDLPLLRGRDFTRSETAGATTGRVAIIDETLARKLWPGEDAVGRQLRIVRGTETAAVGTDAPEPKGQVMEVVGVVAGVRQELSDHEPSPRLYVPLGGNYQAWMNLHVRPAPGSPGSESTLLQTLRAELRRVDPRLPVLSLTTLRDFHNEGLVLWFMRAGSRLFLAFAGIALLLATVGIYGVKAYLVARRTREIGIRMALGATVHGVVWMILRDGLQLTALGLAVGLALALAAGHLVSSKLYGVSGADPAALGFAVGSLALAAALACWLPARRAARVNPMTALRQD